MKALLLSGLVGCVLSLAACSANPTLRTLNKPKDGPDEFKILPLKPLQAPESYTALPVPTPGAANLTDPNPNGDAVTALGGKSSALVPGSGIPSSDGALVSQAARYGIDQDIRQELATIDADFRRRQARFSQLKIVPVDRYQQAYKREALDPYAEASRFRKLGIHTPAAPPKNR
ncbi:MAG: DUF3035 domain-containing protein [Marinibacterium sp.]